MSELRSAACYICGSKYRKVRLALGDGPALCDSDWHGNRDAESTSAALRRVEQERDEMRSEVERLIDVGSKAMRERTEAQIERDEMRAERDRARADLMTARTAYLAQSAELVGARTELDAVRTARDNLERELAELWSTGVIRRSDAGATDG